MRNRKIDAVVARQRRRALIAVAVASACCQSVAASDNAAVFDLGTVVVTGTRPQVGEVGSEQVSSVVTLDEIRRFNRNTVGDAVNLLSGVTLTTNSRNEQMVYLRGYDSRQAPLFIDGIPVYVPYDGYVDFGRFSTADLAAIQVAKGFSSVAYGPNTLGGAINLISRKPTKAFEGDASVGFGQDNRQRAEANLGTNQGTWYLQAGAGYWKADDFSLSKDFTAGPIEKGGRRDNSYYKDDKVSLKFGITPGGGDEYALTYIKQTGEKGQPPSTVPADARYWKWPQWDKESLYFISRTALGPYETLRLRLYNDKFDNELDMFTDATYSGLTAANRSIYHDKTVGGSVELESRRLSGHTVRLIAHYKNDRHQNVDGAGVLGEDFEDTLRSLSVEDAIALGSKTTLAVGYAHHELHPDKVIKTGWNFTMPDKQSSNDPQIGLFHDLDPATRLYATIAQKTRMPTVKDRYSLRLGRYIENPGLRRERALNYEVGYQGSPWSGAEVEAAVFYNDVTDKITTVYQPGQTSCTTTNKCQMQNIGKVKITGVELGVKTPIGNQWEIGGNGTWMDIKVGDPGTQLTSVPETKLVMHALWRAAPAVDLVAFLERDGGRWATNTVEIAGFTTLNLKAVWRPTKSLTTEVGVNNVTDKNYELDYGFPSPGRTWFANARYQF